ncbi:MAG: glycosyltransferase family 2 protein [Hyphomonadaceae bacterium]
MHQKTPTSEQPLVVIATPVYNGESYLRETMESVQAQTYPNLIHLVIDNASTDRTAEIIADFANSAIPVQCVRHETLLPQMVNWNSIIPNVHPNAEWFRLLCADDLIMPSAVEKMVEVGESDPEIGVVGCIHDNNGEIAPALWPIDRTVFDGPEAQRRFFDNCGLIVAPHLLLRREVLTQHSPFFDEYNNAADTDAALRTLSGWKMGFCHEHLAHTRVHEATVTNVDVAPKRLYLFDWFLFLHRYADTAYGPKIGPAMTRRYRRHYMRRLLKLRRSGIDREVWNTHIERLERLGEKPSFLTFADSAIDRILIKFGIREEWMPYPW